MSGDPALPVDDVSLESLLRDRRFGPPPPNDLRPWDFALRWPQGALERRVWPVVSRLLVDKDPTMRARAIEFVAAWSDGAALTTPRVLEVGEKQGALFGAQEVDGESLRDEYARAGATLARKHEGARFAAVLRKFAADGPIGSGAAAVIAQFEPQFVVAQLRQWGPQAQEWAMQAARPLSLYQRDHVIDFLGAARDFEVDQRRQLLALVEATIERDDERMRAIARSVTLAPPVSAAPTTEECRRAIGLD